MLYNGDCYEILDNIPAKSIDLIVTDPPYNYIHGVKGRGLYKQRNRDKALNELEGLSSIKFNPEQFLDMIKPKLKIFNRHT